MAEVLSSIPADSRTTDESHPSYVSTTVYGSAQAGLGIPRFEMPDDEMSARKAQSQDELLMDGSPALNLASFVSTYMEREAEELMMSQMSKNFIDVEEYSSCGEIESRCVNIVARLFNAPLHDADAEALGVSTVGSSEAIILSVLAAKRRWQNARRAQGKSIDKPNLVMNAAVQVCWEKAARYLEVEERYWYCKPGQYVLDPAEAVELVDENTIMVCCILGTTYTGQYEDVKAVNDLLLEHNKKHDLDVHIHVDGASGGFVAPFVVPELEWDFRLPLVCSINASGHKYGLTYAGVGWAVWREKKFLPDEILFTVNYLGAPQVSFTLNFSKSAIQVIGQYYQFLRLGKAGYRSIMLNLTRTADALAKEVAAFQDGKLFEIISEGNGKGLPLVAWKLKQVGKYDEFAIAAHLRQRGWIVPAYTMARASALDANVGEMKLLRVVVREDFSKSRCDQFVRDLKDTVKYLENAPQAVTDHLSKNKHEASKQKPTKHDAKHHHVGHTHSLQGKHGKTHAIC
ncbi:cytosolic nonspecific dipeptidase [Pseudohyphozyma bogoriensis]|nr:cytosolic nonspecific dipeptidase [Pseudohyphozyma bogoriensis]